MQTASRIPRASGGATAAVISRERFDAVIFDLDGVITRTATLHAKAWKRMFDAYLEQLGRADGKTYREFDIEQDYLRHVDGKLRYDGVQSFLESRGIELPRGEASDPPDTNTVSGLGNRKDALFQQLLQSEGAQVFAHSIALVERLRSAGIRTAVVSSSRNCVPILKSVNALQLFEVKVDGIDSDERGLAGKPAPDIFLAAAEALGVQPSRAVVFEDALSGVAAGRAGGFGLVVGVDRTGQGEALRAHGADVVVTDLSLIEVRG